MLLPALSAAREKARLAKCRGTLKEIGLATSLYANDYNGELPYSPVWPFFFGATNVRVSSTSRIHGLLVQYGYMPIKLLMCPNGSPRTKSWLSDWGIGGQEAFSDYMWRISNASGRPKELKRLEAGSSKNPLAADTLGPVYGSSFSAGDRTMYMNGEIYAAWHKKSYNTLFYDGHVGTIQFELPLFSYGRWTYWEATNFWEGLDKR